MPPCGHLHPLLKVRAEYRQIFLEMGYVQVTVIYKVTYLKQKEFFNINNLLQFASVTEWSSYTFIT